MNTVDYFRHVLFFIKINCTRIVFLDKIICVTIILRMYMNVDLYTTTSHGFRGTINLATLSVLYSS